MVFSTTSLIVIACFFCIPVLLIVVPLLLACTMVHWSSIVEPVRKFGRLLTAGAAKSSVLLWDILRWMTFKTFMGIAYLIDLFRSLCGRPSGLRERTKKSHKRKAAESYERSLTAARSSAPYTPNYSKWANKSNHTTPASNATRLFPATIS